MNNKNELLKRALDLIQSVPNLNGALEMEIKAELEKPEQEPFEIDWPEFHYQGMGCGLEDRNITDRYEAMQYGWDCALDAVGVAIPEKIYTSPQQQKPITDEGIRKIRVETPSSIGSIDFARAIEKAHGIE